jgi:hypothetical protein
MKSGALSCPKCGGKFVVNSYYSRIVIESDGSSLKIPIMQARCVEKGCGKTHAILPHFVMPYKRYATDVIEAAILSYEENGGLKHSDCPAEEKTIRGWKDQFKNRGRKAVNQLHKILYEHYSRTISMVKLITLSLFQELEIYIEAFKGFLSGAVLCGSLIGSVNIILSRYSSGYI